MKKLSQFVLLLLLFMGASSQAVSYPAFHSCRALDFLSLRKKPIITWLSGLALGIFIVFVQTVEAASFTVSGGGIVRRYNSTTHPSMPYTGNRFDACSTYNSLYRAGATPSLGSIVPLSPSQYGYTHLQKCNPDSSPGFYVYFNYAQYANNLCPSNSTDNSYGVCTPDSGYSAVNNNGTWSVVPQGQECTSPQVYNSSTGLCETPPGPTNLGLVAVTTAAAAALGAFIGVSAGVPILATSGLATLLTVGVMSFFGSEDPVQPSREAAANLGNTGLQVVLDPNTPLTTPSPKNDNTPPKVEKTSDNKLNPAGGYASPTATLPSWSGAAAAAQYLKTKNGTVEKTIAEISADQTTLTIYSYNGAQTTVNQYSDGSTNVSHTAGLNTTDSTGASTRIPASVYNNYNSAGTRSGGGVHYNQTNVNGSQAGGSNGLDERDPISAGSYGGPGANPNPPSEGETPGGCTGADGLNCESTQLSVLAQQTAVKNAITGQGVDHVAAQDGVEVRLNSAIDAAADANAAALEQAGIIESITYTLESLNNISPWAVLSAGQTAECSKTISMPFGASMKLDICEVQPVIHNVLAFFFFVLLCLGIFQLFSERPEGQ